MEGRQDRHAQTEVTQRSLERRLGKTSPSATETTSDHFSLTTLPSFPRLDIESPYTMSSENSPVDRFVLSPRGYMKILMHCLKYPHSTVNGVLLVKPKSGTKNSSSSRKSSPNGEGGGEGSTTGFGATGGGSSVEIVDVVPLFHLGHGLSPMMEVALLQVRNPFTSFSFLSSLRFSLLVFPSFVSLLSFFQPFYLHNYSFTLSSSIPLTSYVIRAQITCILLLLLLFCCC